MIRQFVFFFLLLFLWQGVRAQMAVKVITIPVNTPVSDTLYIAGNFNNWNPHDAQYALVKFNHAYIINIPPPVKTGVEFKITRGSWAKVECDSTGEDIANHIFHYAYDNAFSVKVAGWKDLLEGNNVKHTGTYNVHILTDSFFIPQLNTYRRIWVYLPPKYDSTNSHYPVFYMQDGQNLFDAATSFSGEWKIDESLNKLFAMGDKGCIVVGIDNGGKERINEYSPWINPSYGGGKGRKYMEFIVNTLKPHIDSMYRTLPGREHTGLFGSSMGGLISLYGAIKYQQVFGMVGVFSPSLWFSDSLYTFVRNTGKKADMRIYFDAGETESAGTVPDLDKMYQLLLSVGFDLSEVKKVIRPDGHHNEAFWSREFPEAYLWLMREK